MKKLNKLIIAAVALAITLTFTGCNSCTHLMKDLESDFAELERDIQVINAITGDTVFTYSGPCYISEGSSSGDMTLGEIEEDISSALDRFAKANGLPEVNWEEENDA